MPANPRAIRQAKTVTLPGDLWSVARVPDSQQVYVGGSDGKIHHVDLAAERPSPTSWDAHVSYVSAVVVAGDQLISAGSDHRLIWWQRATRRVSRTVDAHPRWIRGLALAPNGQTLASVCDDMLVRLWDVASGRLLRELRGHEPRTVYQTPSKLYCCAFSPDGRYLATADQIGDMLIWEVATGRRAATVQAPVFCISTRAEHAYGGIRCVQFAPDGRQLAASGNLGGDTSTITGSTSLIQLFDWERGQRTHDLRTGGNFFYERVAFHQRGDWLVGAGGAGSGQKIVFFELGAAPAAANRVLHQLNSNTIVNDMILDRNSETLLTAGRQGRLILWDMRGDS